MKLVLHRLLLSHWEALLASAVCCIWIAFYTSKGGIGISPDSVAYLSSANHFASEFRFFDYNNLPLVNFPVGYPFFSGVLENDFGRRFAVDSSLPEWHPPRLCTVCGQLIINGVWN